MLHAKVLASPCAHARIKSIDTSQAKALEGVAAVLTWKICPVLYTPLPVSQTPFQARWICSPWIIKFALWVTGWLW